MRAQHLLRQLHGKIGTEQIQFERHLQSAQLLQFLILRKQAQRGVIRTIGQCIKIGREAEHGMVQHIAMQCGSHVRVGYQLA